MILTGFFAKRAGTRTLQTARLPVTPRTLHRATTLPPRTAATRTTPRFLTPTRTTMVRRLRLSTGPPSPPASLADTTLAGRPRLVAAITGPDPGDAGAGTAAAAAVIGMVTSANVPGLSVLVARTVARPPGGGAAGAT